MPFIFDPQMYDAKCQPLLRRDEPNELGPGQPNRSLYEQLRALDPSSIGQELVDPDMAACCVAGLWLLHDFLDESHTISQDVHTATGSYWHGIMHRREPDFSNSKYWFRRVGEHVIFPNLAAEISVVAGSADMDDSTRYLASQTNWDAFAFVDSCEAATGGHGNEQLCRQIAELEWQILFDYCYREAFRT